MISKIKIQDNSNQNGLNLKELEGRIRKYLDRKKSQEPRVGNTSATYKLRNELIVTIYPVNGSSHLDMIVVGAEERIRKAIQALTHIYSGRIYVDGIMYQN